MTLRLSGRELDHFLGNHASLVRGLLDELARAKFPATLGQRISEVAARPGTKSILSADEATAARVRLLESRQQSHLAAIDSLGAPPAREEGRALFPVAVQGGPWDGCASVRELHVGDEVPAGASVPTDADFRRGVEYARTRLLALCDPRHQERLAALRWWVLPDAEAEVADDSVAMAAAVAFASALLRRPVRQTRAFSGVPADRNGDDFAPADAQTLEAKQAALASERPHVGELVTAAPAPETPTSRPKVVECRSLQVLLPHAFESSWHELAPSLDRRRPHAGQDLRHEIRGLLCASPVPLFVHELREALACWVGAARLHDVCVDDVLGQLVADGQATAVPGPRIGYRGAGRPIEDHLLQAHAALAELAARDDARLHGHLPHHLLGATREADAAVALSRLAAGSTLAAASAALEQVAAAFGPDAADRLAGRIIADDALESWLVALAWSLRRAPWLFGELCDQLARAEDWLARARWLQAVIETSLHFLISFSVATSANGPPSEDGARLSRRPSIGLLCKELSRLLGRIDHGLDPAVAHLVRPLVGAFADVADLDQAITTPLNQLLHRPASWARLATSEGERCSLERLRELRPAATTLVVAAVAVAVRAPADVGAGRVILGGILDATGPMAPMSTTSTPSTTIALVCFYRGIIAGRIRYWSFSSPHQRSAPGPGDVAPEHVLWSRAARTAIVAGLDAPTLLPAAGPFDGAAARPSIAGMPLPLARSWATACRAVGDIAALDLTVATLLRLVWFTLRAADPKPLSRREDWLGRMTKRRLVEEIEQHPDQELARALGGFLLDGGAMAAIIDRLERIEHLPAFDDAATRDIHRDLGSILARAPWEDVATLVGEVGGQWRRLHGYDVAGPAQVGDAVAPGATIAMQLDLVAGRRIVSLAPFLRLEPHAPLRVHLLLEHHKGEACYGSIDRAGRYEERTEPWPVLPDGRRRRLTR